MNAKYITDDERIKRGTEISKILMLRKKRDNGRYQTTRGDKTTLGLFNTLYRLINDDEQEPGKLSR